MSEVKTGRRTALKYIATGVICGAVAGVGGYLAAPKKVEVVEKPVEKVVYKPPPKRPIPKEPIKIGVMAWATGPYGFFLGQGIPSAEILAEEINASGGILGRKVEIISIDHPSVDVCVREYKRLVTEEKVDLIFETGGSGFGLAIAPLAEEMKTLTFHGDVWTVELFLKKVPKPKYNFRIAQPDSQSAIAIVLSIKKYYPDVSTVAIISPDYAWGRDQSAMQQEALEALIPGTKVVLDLYPAVGEKDYTSYITKINDIKPDVTIVNLFAGDFIVFNKQALGMGFYKNTKPAITALNSDVPMLTKEEVPEGVLAHCAHYWFLWPPHERYPINGEHVKKFIAKTGKYLTYNPQNAYVTIMGYKIAVERAYEKLGEYPTTEQIIEELEGMGFNALAGHGFFRPEDHQWTSRQFMGLTKHVPEYDCPIIEPITVIDPAESLPPPGMSAKDWIMTWKK